MTLDLGHRSPPSQAKDSETKIPTSRPADCKGLTVQAGSAGGGGGRAGSRRNRSSVLVQGKRRSGKPPGAGTRPGGYLRVNADAAPVVAMAARHLGAPEP